MVNLTYILASHAPLPVSVVDTYGILYELSFTCAALYLAIARDMLRRIRNNR